MFKHGDDQARQFWLISPLLQLIAVDAAFFIKYKFDKSFIVTSIIRESGIHAYGRALDARTTHLEPEEIAKVEHYINDKYPYGKGNYKTCLYHKASYAQDVEYHFHLQCKYEPRIYPK